MPTNEVNLGRLFTYPFDSQVRSIQSTRSEKPERLVAWFRALEGKPEDFRIHFDGLDVDHQEKFGSLQRAYEAVVEREFSCSPNKRNITQLDLGNAFQVLPDFVKIVSRRISHALMIVGPGGTGKTWTVLETLEKENRKEPQHFIRIPGYASPLGLYTHLYENLDKLVVFDDCDAIFKDEHGINILKSVLDTIPKRVVTWRSASTKVPVPKFEFTGQVIFISNMDPSKTTNPHFQALLTRTMTLLVGGSKEELLMHMVSKIREIGAALTPDEQNEVLTFLKDHYRQYNILSLRLLRDLCNLRKFSAEKWQQLALALN